MPPLVVEEDGLAQGAIGQRCSSGPGTVGAVLRLLEEKGFVSRRRHPEDGRARAIYLIPKGRELHRRARKACMGFQEALGNSVRTPGEKKAVLTVLDRIRDTMTRPVTSE